MLDCFITTKTQNALPISLVKNDEYAAWLEKQSPAIKGWLVASNFKAEPWAWRLLPSVDGGVQGVICCIGDFDNVWSVGHLSMLLPEGDYYIEHANSTKYAIGWGLGAYQYTRYKKPLRTAARLLIEANDLKEVSATVESITQVRDWINTPTDDMGPTEFAENAERMAKQYGAKLTQTIGDDLLKNNYASIYTVGRASDDAPRLLDMRFGNEQHPKLTLVGKGVCFDSGGLDIKNAAGMLLMKKDMAGGAHVFGLARMIMEAGLPVNLRVLVPLVENVISGNAYRPGDIITSRKGITIEVGNTDCEGRVILADALTEAASEKPDLLIDMASLTGAARIALGTDLPAVFSNNDAVVEEVIAHGLKTYDPMWRLPLYGAYRESLSSNIADINNNNFDGFAGAITAAIFLQEFVPNDVPWLHFDMMAWNLRARPGRPVGGEACALRALFAYVRTKYATKTN